MVEQGRLTICCLLRQRCSIKISLTLYCNVYRFLKYLNDLHTIYISQ